MNTGNASILRPRRPRPPAGQQPAQAAPQQLPPPQHPQEKPKLGVKPIMAMLKSKSDAIARIIPPNIGMSVDGLIQNAMQMVMRERRLIMCTPYSVLDSVLAAAAVGLDFVADQAYLVPHEAKKRDPETGAEVHVAWRAAFWPGYKGMLTVANRYGWLMDVQEVRTNDEIDIAKGTENRINHKVGFGNRGEIIGVYCVVRDRQHRVCFIETMDMDDIAAVRKNTDVWKYHEGQMSRKSVVRRAYKFLPKDNSQMRLLAEVDDRFEEGQDIHDLVNPHEPDGGEYTGPLEDDSEIPQEEMV